MKSILTLNPIARASIAALDPAKYTVSDKAECPDAVLVRSAPMHETVLPKSVLAVARAGAGVNTIPLDRYAAEGVVVFNTPGANANGVKELALASLILASRDVIGGVEWVKTVADDPNLAKIVEKGKSKFAGREIYGKTLGVIGLGAIGGMVANMAENLGMRVIGFDPFLTVRAAWNLSRAVKKAESYDEIYREADYITLHVPATKDTAGMISRETLAKMKDGVRLINLARADLVVAEDLKEALRNGKVASYVTDFPTPELASSRGVISIPHLGASTEESEENCAVMAAEELTEYLETGNIRNSVNYPNVSLPHTGAARLCLCHRNLAGMLSAITAVVSSYGINIENLSNASRGEYAYTIVELGVSLPPEAEEAIGRIDGMIRVRML